MTIRFLEATLHKNFIISTIKYGGGSIMAWERFWAFDEDIFHCKEGYIY